jgi:hypothetical protein
VVAIKKNKIAFAAMRTAELKLFLPIIQELLISGKFIPVLITTATINKGEKKAQNYDASFNPFHNKMEICNVDHMDEITNVLVKSKIDLLIIASVYPINVMKQWKENKKSIIYLQHSTDIVSIYPKTAGVDFFKLVDIYLLFAPYWGERMIKELRSRFDLTNDEVDRIGKKIFIVGMPELDQVKTFNKQAIRDKYKISKTAKKIIFFDPVGYLANVPNFYYRYSFCQNGLRRETAVRAFKNLYNDLRVWPAKTFLFPQLIKQLNSKNYVLNYKELFLKLRKYCNENNYLLVCKSRPKNNDPAFIKSGSDLYIYDQGYLPFTYLELLFISDAYVGFTSSGIMEAVHCNLPVLSFHVFPTEFEYGSYGGNVYRYLEEGLTVQGEFMNFPGVNAVCNWDQNEDAFINSLGEQKIDPQSRQEYVKKFLAYDDGNSGKRIVDLLENKFSGVQ